MYAFNCHRQFRFLERFHIANDTVTIFEIVTRDSVTVLGIVKAIQSALVFVVGGVTLCHMLPSQCFTLYKGGGLLFKGIQYLLVTLLRYFFVSCSLWSSGLWWTVAPPIFGLVSSYGIVLGKLFPHVLNVVMNYLLCRITVRRQHQIET